MKTISILKKLIKFYYYFLVLAFGALAIVVPIQYRNGKPNNLSLVGDYNLYDLSFWKFSIILLVFLALLSLYIRAVFLLKKCLNDLSNSNYFSILVTTSFKKAGKFFIISGICFSVFKFVLGLILTNNIKLVADNTLILPLIMGLFLMFLSEVFVKAKKTEEENNLTI
jgi:hypothetical protein